MSFFQNFIFVGPDQSLSTWAGIIVRREFLHREPPKFNTISLSAYLREKKVQPSSIVTDAAKQKCRGVGEGRSTSQYNRNGELLTGSR